MAGNRYGQNGIPISDAFVVGIAGERSCYHFDIGG